MPLELIREGFSEQWIADRPTLLDLAIAQGGGIAEMIDETTAACPEFRIFPAKAIKGTTYPQLVRVGLPKVGFRNANEGAIRGKTKHIKRLYHCHIFDPRWECDKAIADQHEDGPAAQIAEAAEGILLASMQHMGSVFYYGTLHDSKAAAGMLEIFDDSMEINATGSTDAEKSSVWGICSTSDQVQWLLGGGGTFSVSPVSIRDIIGEDGKPLEGYVQQLTAHIGLKIRDIRSAGRIKNLTKQTDKGLTDELLAQLWAKFPRGGKPTMWLMNETQLLELRDSRKTELNPNPPIPTEAHGIPITVTESIVDGHDGEKA